MGLFDNSKKETTAVMNFDTFLTNGHFLGNTEKPIEMKPALNQEDMDRYICQFSPRDYPKHAKDYKEIINRVYWLPIAKHCLHYINASEYKRTAIVLPNDPTRLPKGLPDIWKEKLTEIIITTYTQFVVDTMYWAGIKSRDIMLKKILTLDYMKDHIDFASRLVDERMKYNQNQSPLQYRREAQPQPQGQLKGFAQ